MNLNQRLEPLPKFETAYSKRYETILLAAVLIVGLTFVSPALTAITGVPILVFVAIVGAVYGALTVLLRQVRAGVIAGLLVTSTFAADVPLGVANGLLGTPDASLWLFELPLVIGLAIAAVERWDRNTTITRTHLLFAGFVTWTFVAAAFGAGPRPIVALTYAFHFFVGFVVFALVAAAVEHDVLDFRTVVTVLVITVCAQATFAFAQLLHGRPFGFSSLGETGRFAPRIVSFGPIHLSAGIYLSGFTGATNALVALVLLAAPITLAYAVLARTQLYTRAAAGIASILLFILVVLSVKSSARGAAFVAIITFIGLVAVVVRGGLTSQFATVRRRLVAGALLLGTGILALAAQSQRSGTAINVPEEDVSTGSSGPITGLGTGSRSSGSDASGASNQPAATGVSDTTLLEYLDGTQIPLFDLGSLGIRVQQYIAAIDIALEYPLFGLGGANFPYIAIERYGIRPAKRATEPVANAIHSAYFSVLASTGWPGFILFCATLVGIVWATVGLIRRRTVSLWVSVGVFCAFAAYLAYIFWDITFTSTIPGTIPFWVLAGAIVGVYTRHN